MVVSAHIVLVVVGHDDGGGGLKNMRLSKLFSELYRGHLIDTVVPSVDIVVVYV